MYKLPERSGTAQQRRSAARHDATGAVSGVECCRWVDGRSCHPVHEHEQHACSYVILLNWPFLAVESQYRSH